MQPKNTSILAIMTAGLLAGCSGDAGLFGGADNLTTASVAPTAAASTPRADPACVALATRIDGLRREGVTERVEKAASGKGATVAVKRASLAQIADLDRANAEYQSKCSAPGLRTAAAAAAPAAAVVSARAPTTTAPAAPARP